MGNPVLLGRSRTADLCLFQCILHYQHGAMMDTGLFILPGLPMQGAIYFYVL
jgi:hypothetical protein